MSCLTPSDIINLVTAVATIGATTTAIVLGYGSSRRKLLVRARFIKESVADLISFPGIEAKIVNISTYRINLESYGIYEMKWQWRRPHQNLTQLVKKQITEALEPHAVRAFDFIDPGRYFNKRLYFFVIDDWGKERTARIGMFKSQNRAEVAKARESQLSPPEE